MTNPAADMLRLGLRPQAAFLTAPWIAPPKFLIFSQHLL